MLQIEVNGEFLELPSDFRVQFNRFNPIFQTEGVKQDDYTLPIPLPNSDHNARILGNPSVIENQNRFPARMEAILHFGGMPRLRGQLRIKSPVNSRVITVNFVSGVSEISPDIRDKNLREIMDEEIIIHNIDFNRQITLEYQPLVSSNYAISVNDIDFNEASLDDLIDAINDHPDLTISASIPTTDQLTIGTSGNGEFLDFWVGFLPSSEWILAFEPVYTEAYYQIYSDFINNYHGISPDNKLRFPVSANYHGYDNGVKRFPIVNYFNGVSLEKNFVYQPSFGGELGGTYGNPKVYNSTSLAPYVTVEYVLERIAAYYEITIVCPFLGGPDGKLIIDHPNVLDRPIRYIESQTILLFERSFNISSLVPDMKVNEFLKALQGIGYGMEYDAGTRTLIFVEREAVLTNPDFVDFSGKYGDIEDIQNQPKGGITLKHLEDSSDSVSPFGSATDENNGKKSFVLGDGKKIVTTGFHVPEVINNSLVFPITVDFPKTVLTRNMSPSENFTLRLAFSVTSFFGVPTMLINNGTYSLSWYGDIGLAERTWKYWKGLESGSPFINITIYLSETEAFSPYWKEKLLIDRNKYIIRSFDFEINDGSELIPCDAELVRVDYSIRL